MRVSECEDPTTTADQIMFPWKPRAYKSILGR